MRILVVGIFLITAGVLFALGGETCPEATVINSLPYWDSTSTEGFLNDYSLDPSNCTGHTTLGPDAVYMYTSNQPVCLSLNVVVPFTYWNPALYVLTDCENLVCVAGADLYEAGSPEALYLLMQPGVTYYFVVDGRTSSDYGPYKISISECQTFIDETHFEEIPIDFKVTPSVSKGQVSISFSLPENEMVTLSVYDVTGRKVITLHKGVLMRGTFTWNGADKYGRILNSGVYFARLETKKKSISVPFLLSK